MELLCGKFQQENSENLDEYYKTIGVPYFVRLMICSSKPLIEISKEEDTWTFKTSTLFRTSELTFKLGEEYVDKMASGVELKNVTEIDGTTMITKSKATNGQVFERVYTFNEKEMIMHLSKGLMFYRRDRNFKDKEKVWKAARNSSTKYINVLLGFMVQGFLFPLCDVILHATWMIFTHTVFHSILRNAQTLKHESGIEAKRFFRRLE